MSFCKKCGHELEDSATICTNCDTSVVSDCGVAQQTPDVNVHTNNEQPKKKKSIFKRWWFWLAVVLVAAVVVVAVVALWQKPFVDYNNEVYKNYMNEAKAIGDLVDETMSTDDGLQAARDIWTNNNVKGRMDKLLSDAKAYESDDEDVQKLHGLLIKSLEDLNAVVVYVDEALVVGRYYPDEYEELISKVDASCQERDALWKKLVDEYGVKVTKSE